jgi:hypothetical protein
MKILKKADIIKLKQVDHVISENTILADIDHPFLVLSSSLITFNRSVWQASPKMNVIFISSLNTFKEVNYSHISEQKGGFH